MDIRNVTSSSIHHCLLHPFLFSFFKIGLIHFPTNNVPKKVINLI